MPHRRSDRMALPSFTRRAPLGTVDAAARTVEVTWTAGATVRRRRYDDDWGEAIPFDETLVVTPEAIDFSVLNAGGPVLDSHQTWSTRGQVAVVERAWIADGEGRAIIRFPRAGVDEAADRMWGMVSEGIIRNLSCGYTIQEAEVIPARSAVDVEQLRATRWTPMELSFVTIPADRAAQTRADATTERTYPVIVTRPRADNQEGIMPDTTQAADHPAGETQNGPPQETRAAPPSPPPVQRPAPVDEAAIRAATAAERTRISEITSIGTRAGLPDDQIQAAIADGSAVDAFRVRAFDHMAGTADRSRTSAVQSQVIVDETETRRAAMQEALSFRLAPPSLPGAARPEPSAAARAYVDYSIVELAAARLGERRVPFNFAAREEILRRAFHSATDFPVLFAGAINQALAARYIQAQPTYRRIARQRTYTDFRDHTAIRTGDFPDLQEVNPDGGELKSGTFGATAEKTAVKAYGVKVGFSRQMLVNDSLDSISQVLNDRGLAVARFEDRTFYAMALGGANKDGPQLLETGRQVFNTTDKTKAAAGTAITVAALSEARAALRKRKTVDGAEMELTAAILLTGPDQETAAQQILAPVQAQQTSNVNPFSGTLSTGVTAKITGNEWYVFASPSEAAVFEWGLLEGYSAPRMRIDNPFGVQGVQMSLEHDFGCGAIDFRGGWKNPGN